MERINRLLDAVFGAVIAVALLFVSVMLAFNVVTRYGLGFNFPWSEELTRYTIIWVTFLGAGICARAGMHVRVDVLEQVAPPKLKQILGVISDLGGAFFALILLVLGWQLVAYVARNAQFSPAMMLPLWIVYLGIPIGCAAMVLAYVGRLLAAFQQPGGKEGQGC